MIVKRPLCLLLYAENGGGRDAILNLKGRECQLWLGLLDREVAATLLLLWQHRLTIS